MMRSLYSGVSGLQNHQTRMDVVGNNISNVNTIGYKRNRVTFEDMLYQNMSGAAAPEENKGGVNAKQVGLGMSVSAIDTIHSQAALQTTGKKTDISITGEGFFVLQEGDQTFFTRAGNFSIDANGTLVNPAGLQVQGWQANAIGEVDSTGTTTKLDIPVGGKIEARATSRIKYKCNLNNDTPVVGADATPAQVEAGEHQTTYTIYDSKGSKLNLALNFRKVGLNVWRARAQLQNPQGETLNVSANVAGPAANDNPAGETADFFVQFGPDGKLRRVAENQGMDQDLLDQGDLNVNLQFTPEPEQGGIAVPPQTFQLELGTSGDIDGVTQFADATTTKAVLQDGTTMGYLRDFRVDKSGFITGIYSNGDKRRLGRIAMATFINPGGMEKIGSTNFIETNNSGAANIGVAGQADKGKMVAGALEMSNVDLADSFTDMIVTQRGFQANSKSITTSDQMIQELLTLKR